MKRFSKAIFTRTIFLLRLRRLPPQTHPLAKAAVHALTSSNYPTKGGRCQEWTRKVWQAVYGHKFDFAWKDTAALASRAFAGTHYDVPLHRGSKPGDILYRESGNNGSGHVGIRVAGNMVAENSSLHDDDDHDARGLRTFDEFGPIERIVRLS